MIMTIIAVMIVMTKLTDSINNINNKAAIKIVVITIARAAIEIITITLTMMLLNQRTSQATHIYLRTHKHSQNN